MHIISIVSGERETMSYFAAHFEEQLKLYNTQVGWLCQSVCLGMCLALLLAPFTLPFGCGDPAPISHSVSV